MVSMKAVVAVAVAVLASPANAVGCPHLQGMAADSARMPAGHPNVVAAEGYAEALANVDFDAVKARLTTLMTDSQDWWPADDGHYGPLMVRLAWHCAGTYRLTDGRGGCDGGRMRFEPERSWPDNTNLDKARSLLWPIKEEFGLGLSWGDLITLAGNVAIESMGGPDIPFCAGRVDDVNGSESALLGPTAEQEALYPCAEQGDCKDEEGLGATTVGLIYVNPGGPGGNPVPSLSAPQIRDTFARMGMNDRESVALIGGGHAFGKAHGACPDGPGPSPIEDPTNPWPGLCSEGTFTSGFEGPWTSEPSKWDNQYFELLRDQEWEMITGPGDNPQWKIVNSSSPLMMLTSDLALVNDDSYEAYVNEFASSQAALDEAFAEAWYKLTSRDMGPVARCAGVAPAARAFQHPLPAPPATLADFGRVRASIQELLRSESQALTPDTLPDGTPYYGAYFIQLAYQCASTLRVTDYLGGCNGARIRQSPQKDWAANVGMEAAMNVLQGVKDQYGDSLTWADLIVLAGTVAVEDATGQSMPFCGGRSDAEAGDNGSQDLKENGQLSASALVFKENMAQLGLTDAEVVALAARARSAEVYNSLGYDGTWGDNASTLSNAFFATLLGERWASSPAAGDLAQFKAEGKDLYMTPVDMHVRFEPELQAIAMEYASNNQLFLERFAAAWTKLMNADRFDGPTGNVCAVAADDSSSDSELSVGAAAGVAVAATATLCALLWVCTSRRSKQSGSLQHGGYVAQA